MAVQGIVVRIVEAGSEIFRRNRDGRQLQRIQRIYPVVVAGRGDRSEGVVGRVRPDGVGEGCRGRRHLVAAVKTGVG